MNQLRLHKCKICLENFQLSGARLVHHLRNHSPPSIAQLLNDLIINETFEATDEEYDYFFEFTTSFRRSVRVNVVAECSDENIAIPDLVAVKMETLDSSEPELEESTGSDPLRTSRAMLRPQRKRRANELIEANYSEEEPCTSASEAQFTEPDEDSDEYYGKSSKGSHQCKHEPGTAKRRLLDTNRPENLPFEFTPGARLGSTLLYSISEKQLYRLSKVFSKYKRYVCNIKACRSTVFLRGNELNKSPSFKDHNHADQEAIVAKNKFEASCKAKCLEGGIDPSLVFTAMLSKDPVGGSKSSYDKMKRHLSRLKKIASTANSTISNSDESPQIGKSAITAHLKKAETIRKELAGRSRVRFENSVPLPFEYTPGARMGSTLLYTTSEKQLYRLKNEFTNYKRYVCNVRQCHATLVLRDGVLKRAPQFKEHNHPDQELVAAKNKFEASCKAKCMEGTVDPSQVFTSMLREDPVGGSNSSYDKMKRNLGRLKKIVSKNSPIADCRNKLQNYHTRETIADDRVVICQSLTETQSESAEIVNDSVAIDSIRLEFETSEHLPFEFTPGARMGSTLLYSIKEKQLYRCNKEFSSYKRYVCVVKDCRAALFLRENELSRSPSYNGHNHADQEAVAAKNKFEALCKSKCLEGDANPSSVFTSMLSEDPVGGRNSSYEKMKRHLDRLKKTATKALSDPDSKHEPPNSRENTYEENKAVGSSHKPVEIRAAAKYTPPTVADAGQKGYSLRPMMVEVDRTLTQEFYQSNLHPTIYDQHVYY